MAYYRCGEVIKMRRKALGSKREDYDADGPVGMTVYRLEEGKHKGTEKTYRRLTRAMGVEESLGQGILKTTEMEHLIALNEIMWNTRDGKLQSAEEQVERVQKQIDAQVPRNKQYLTAKHAELQYKKGELTAEGYEQKLKEALACTILAYKENGIEGWPVHDEELVLLIMLSNVLKKQKKFEEQKELAEQMLHCLEHDYLCFELKNRYHILAAQVLADATGSLGNHREAVRIDKEAIENCKQWNEFRSIEALYYDIHWNYRQIKKQETLTAAEEREAYQCLLQAYYINKAKGNKKSLYEKKLREYYPEALVSG